MADQPVNIDKSASKISRMFDSIAPGYDFLNHLLSFGIDKRWRKKAVGMISEKFSNPSIIDVATGTGDLAIEAAKINPSRIIGIDISDKMLEAGRRKIKRNGYESFIELINCDSENICFEDNIFDAGMVAFGVRNFSDPVKGLSEMKRVIRKGGIIVVLEFSKPEGFVFKNVYNFYFRYFLPFIGDLFSGGKGAYRYLNQSVMEFADKQDFVNIMERAGLSEIKQTRITGGIATIYSGIKD